MARLATTAVVAGTAAHMGARSAQRSAAAAQPQYAPEPAPQQAPEYAPAPPAAGGLDDGQVEELKQFAELNKQGVLTDEEFAAKKAQILGI